MYCGFLCTTKKKKVVWHAGVIHCVVATWFLHTVTLSLLEVPGCSSFRYVLLFGCRRTVQHVLFYAPSLATLRAGENQLWPSVVVLNTPNFASCICLCFNIQNKAIISHHQASVFSTTQSQHKELWCSTDPESVVIASVLQLRFCGSC